jgi:hypothetical protein
MKKLKNEKKAQLNTQTMDKGTNIDAIKGKKPNIVMNEVVSIESLPKF